MRWYQMALGLVLAATLSAGCSSSSCAAGTLTLTVYLLDTSALADTITVFGDDPGAAVSESFPHTPNPDPGTLGETTKIVVTWPQGFPSKSAVHLTIDAVAGGQVIGAGMADLNLGKSCSVSDLFVAATSATTDGAAD
jgi:hypothetical protein